MADDLDNRLDPWNEVRDRCDWSSLLIGNGFSQNVWPHFGYASLYEVAGSDEVAPGLTDEDSRLFDQLNTHNFELVLSALAIGRTVTEALGNDARFLLERYESIRTALIDAVHHVHIPWMETPDKTLDSVAEELARYASVYWESNREARMGVFDRLFGGKKEPDFPPEMVKIFEKIDRFLTDDQTQNAALPDAVRKVIESGPPCDEIPGARGEFGRDVNNPIPVNGPIGELAYLSSLQTSSGAGLFGHRLGSIENIDVYETVSTDGKTWDILFLSYYHPRKSRRAPAGYRIASKGERRSFITCTNCHVDGFPIPMEAAIRECMRRIVGFPIRPPDIAQTLSSARFVRTSLQSARLAGLTKLGMQRAANYKDVAS